MAKQKMVFRAHYAYDVEQASFEAAIPPGEHGESLTVQSHTEDADINVMIKKFLKTGQIPQSVRVPEYGDYLGITDFRGALDAVLEAQDNFNQMPAEVRARFNNDPAEFHDFCMNPDNLPELRKMGLAVPEKPEDVNDGRSRSGPGENAGKPTSSAAGSAGSDGASAGPGAAHGSPAGK